MRCKLKRRCPRTDPPRRKFLWWLPIALILLACFAGSAAAETRIALVIGINAYQHAPALVNPLNDARAIGDALRRLNFEVQELDDADNRTLAKGLREFGIKAQTADTALVYYAGHGVQVDHENYLVPADARLERAHDVLYEALPLSLVLDEVSQASKIGIVMLDSCRDNPFAERLARSLNVAGRAVSKASGLARVDDVPRNTVVVMAARAGQIAEDGQDHSPFAAAILAHLQIPGLELDLFVRSVRETVLKATQNRQEPYAFSSRGVDPFYFYPRPPNRPPVIGPIPTLTVADNAASTHFGIPRPVDPDQDLLTVRVIGLPHGGDVIIEGHRPAIGEAFSLDHFMDGTFKPDGTVTGAIGTLDILVEDGRGGSVVGSLPIVVRPSKPPPVVVPSPPARPVAPPAVTAGVGTVVPTDKVQPPPSASTAAGFSPGLGTQAAPIPAQPLPVPPAVAARPASAAAQLSAATPPSAQAAGGTQASTEKVGAGQHTPAPNPVPPAPAPPASTIAPTSAAMAPSVQAAIGTQASPDKGGTGQHTAAAVPSPSTALLPTELPDTPIPPAVSLPKLANNGPPIVVPPAVTADSKAGSPQLALLIPKPPAPASQTPLSLPVARELASEVPCALLDVRETRSSDRPAHLSVSGPALPSPELNAFLKEVGGPTGSPAAAITKLGAGHCPVLGSLADLVRRSHDDGSMRISLPATPVAVGAVLTVNAGTISARALYADLFSADGVVQHLRRGASTRSPGEKGVVIKALISGSPGLHLLVTLESPELLGLEDRPESESATDYLWLLQKKLLQLGPRASELRADLVTVSILPAAAHAPATAPVTSAQPNLHRPTNDPRCADIIASVQLGEGLTDANRIFLKTSCGH